MNPSNPSADLILDNAAVTTLDPTNPRARAVAVRGSRILCAGSREDARAFTGAKTQVIDCEGKAVVPGFIDAHCHPLALAARRLSIDCSPASVRSIADIRKEIRRRAQGTPEGQWLMAAGYNEFYLLEKRHPNRWDLDRAAPNHPVRLSHRSGHACVPNSLAMERLHISSETAEPPGGLVDRDVESGEPNGLVFEMDSYIDRQMPTLSDEDLLRGVRLANQEFLSHGITSLQDASWHDSLGRLQVLRRLKEQDRLLPRLSMMVGAQDLEEFEGEGLLEESQPQHPVRLGAVKIVLHTATGSLNPPQHELNMLVFKAHQAGLQVAIHAVERHEVAAAAAALEYAVSRAHRPDHRHRIEHCSICPPDLVQHLRRLQAVVVTQPSFLYHNGERYLATVPPEDSDFLYPIGSLLNSGLVVAAGSDAPVAPVNPLTGIYAAVTRKAENRQALLPQEGISVGEALRLYTSHAAHASFEGRLKGSIAPGMLADLVILSHDIMNTPPEEIRNVAVLSTIIDGKVVWQK
ncbi:MAG: amidohydrolase [Chloroflexi bacterium]|nr:amidohydrolase [Chloroflexota bacterium]